MKSILVEIKCSNCQHPLSLSLDKDKVVEVPAIKKVVFCYNEALQVTCLACSSVFLVNQGDLLGFSIEINGDNNIVQEVIIDSTSSVTRSFQGVAKRSKTKIGGNGNVVQTISAIGGSRVTGVVQVAGDFVGGDKITINKTK